MTVRMQKQTTERKLITHKHFEYFANKTQKLKGLQKMRSHEYGTELPSSI